MIDLQLKKQKLDNDSIQEDSGISIQGDGVIITDRNSLLEKLRNMK
jgi:agmatine/peptidylarginine deiminase